MNLSSVELQALLRRQFQRRHPEWFDVGNYRAPTPKEARKLGRLREAEYVKRMMDLARPRA